MNKKKIISSVLATGMALSAVPTEAIAQEAANFSNNEIVSLSEDNNDDFNDAELYVTKTGETDTSISISWSPVESAAMYSVTVNNDIVADNVDSTDYKISELESAGEYFIVVSAYDESGNLLIESNELRAHTNLTVSSDYTLTEDLNAANITISGGTLNLNGYTLTVDGDVWLTNGYLNVNKGKLYVGGDLNMKYSDANYGNGYLTMQNAEDYILVNGNMCVASRYNYGELTAGTIELKGDFTQITYSRSNNFYCSGSHKVILSGESLQAVSFASTQSQFNKLDVQNFSEDGVVFSTAATVVELLDNGCNVSFANGERSGWTLEEDETIDGDLNLSRGTLDLNGHKLTITGNLIQSGGDVLVNGGELEVQGSYRVQALNGSKYTTSPGTLTMKNDSDTVKVGGDFVMQSTKSHSGLLSAGMLEIGGNLTQLSGGSSYNFCTSGTHTVVLNGAEKQTINIYDNYKDYSRIANLKIQNTSAEGVDIASRIYILGKLYNTDSVVTKSTNLHITSTTEFPDSKWNYDANFVENRTVPANLSFGGSAYINASLTLTSDIAVAGNLSIGKDLNLNGYTLAVDGDVRLNSGYLNVNKGKLYIGGDFNLKYTDNYYSNGYLTMQNAEDYILVNGNMLAVPYYSGSKLTAGTLEIKGDFTQKHYSSNYQNNFCCSGSHKVILSGEGLQTVSFDSTKSQFNILEIRKPLNIGYIINSNTKWNELVENYTDISEPAVPTNLQFVRSTSTSVMMRWTGSEDSYRLNCYEIYRDGKLVGTTKQTEFIDNGLKTHTQYEYHIVALGANGIRSKSSNTIKAATDVDAYAPTAPTGVQAVIRADGSVYLTWIASSDNVSVDGYNLYRNGEYIGNTVGTVYNDKNAEPGYHEYYVEAFDNEGNNSLFSSSIYADSMPPQKPVLHISEVTPMRISFKWDSEDNIEIDHFEVYKNGELFKNTKSQELTDASVTASGEYSYYVIAIDTSGNVSEASDTKKITAKNDEEKPEIVISEQTLTESNKALRITCIDDVLLSSLTAEIKSPSSDMWISLESESLSQKSQIVNLDLGDYLTDSGDYQIRANLTDAAGNTSTVESGFSYAQNELADITVSAENNGCSVNLTWTSASENSDIFYEIRRVDPNGTEKHITTTKSNELNYIDSGLYPLSEYSYVVIARDENLYSTQSNTVNITSGKDTVAPVSVADGYRNTVVGYETLFDGSRSGDNFGIKNYKWNFGDGATADGTNVTHTFTKSGKYTVTLTVIDESGNSSSDTMTVTVYDDDYSISEVLVTDENGTPIPYPTAYVKADGTATNLFNGNKNGIVMVIAKSGTYDFSFFANDYLPSKQSFSIEGIQIGDMRHNVSLTKSELVTAKFEIEELDVEEVKNHGIDVTAPENQHVSKVEMTIKNNVSGSGSDNDLSKFNIYVNQKGEIISVDHNDSFTSPSKGIIQTISMGTVKDKGTVKTSTTIATLGGGISNSGDSKELQSNIHVIQLIKGTMISLSVTEYSWLKDFYDVSITITNNASEGFDIIDPKATINLPEGLSLANADKINSVTRTMNTIKGGTSETVSWTVRGESSGVYTVTVDVDGVLTPFGIPVKAQFSNKDKPIRVEGGDALHLELNAGGSKADFTLTNVSQKDVHNVNASMGSNDKFDDAVKIVAKYPSGLIEKTEWKDKSKGLKETTVYLPVGMDTDTDTFDLKTLKPGESIVGMVWYTFNEADD